jgi:hypothetical protein
LIPLENLEQRLDAKGFVSKLEQKLADFESKAN